MLRASDRWFARHFWKRLMSFFLSSASLTSSRMSRWEWAGAVEEERRTPLYTFWFPPKWRRTWWIPRETTTVSSISPLEKVSRQRDTKPNLSIPKNLFILSFLCQSFGSQMRTHIQTHLLASPAQPKQKIKRREFWCIFSADVYYIYMRLSISVWCVFVLCPFNFIYVVYVCVCRIFLTKDNIHMGRKALESM